MNYLKELFGGGKTTTVVFFDIFAEGRQPPINADGRRYFFTMEIAKTLNEKGI